MRLSKKISSIGLLVLSIVLISSSLSAIPSSQITGQTLSSYYIPTYLEFNQSLNNPSTIHNAAIPVLVGDLGNDGAFEILTGSDSGKLYVYNGSDNQYSHVLNVSIGSLNPTLGADQTGIYSIALGEINKNPSSQDVLVGNLGHVTILEWNGSGFVFKQDIELWEEDRIVTNIIVEDLDDDGENEIIFVSGLPAYGESTSHDGEIYVLSETLFQDNPGDWIRSNTRARNKVRTRSYQNEVSYTAVIGDPDNDGKKEIVAHIDGRIIVINGSTYVEEWDSDNDPQLQNNVGTSYGMAVGDVNEDGKNELVLGEDTGVIKVLVSVAEDDYDLLESLSVGGSSHVWGLKIVDSDDDARNELISTTIEGNLSVYEWDPVQTSLELEDPQIGWIGTQAGPFNHITCWDADNDSLTELMVGKAGPNNGLGISESDQNGRLLVYGYVSTDAEVLSQPGYTIVGNSAFFDVQYNRTDLIPSQGITNLSQVAALDNDTQSPWEGGEPDFAWNSGGNYTIELFTTGMTGGNYTAKVYLLKPGFEPGVVYVNITLTGTPTIMTILSGADNSSGFWETYNDTNPYVNDTRKKIEFSYKNNVTGEGLEHGIVTASFKYPNGTQVPGKESLAWQDMFLISNQAPEYKGIYRVQLDTIGLHVGNYTLTIRVQRQWYLSSETDIVVHVDPIPSRLLVTVRTAEDGNLTVYEDELFELTVIFYDTFQGKNIIDGSVNCSHGEVNYTLDEESFGSLKTGVYRKEMNSSDPDLNLTSGNNSILIRGNATDYENANYNLVIPFRLRSDASLILSALPTEIMVGEDLIVEATLTFEDGSLNVTGKKIEFLYWFDGEQKPVVDSYTNADGKASLTITAPVGVTRIQVTAIYDAEEDRYANPTSSEAYTSSGKDYVLVTTVLGKILGISPFLGAGALAAVAAGFSYRQFVIVPKRKRRLAAMEKVAETFSNLRNIQDILILEKQSGLVLFERPFREKPFNPDLFGGFIQAISSFGGEISDAKDVSLQELTYRNFRILLNDGEYVRVALILSGRPTETLLVKLKLFTAAFEETYRKQISEFNGSVEAFDRAFDIVDDIFELTLILPHKIPIETTMATDLTPLQKDLVRLTKELLKGKDYFYPNELISFAMTVRKETMLEIAEAVYYLVRNRYFVPIIL